MITIRLPQLIQEIRKLAQEKPDHRYDGDNSGCFYTVQKGQASCLAQQTDIPFDGCLIGQALIRCNPAIAHFLRMADCPEFDFVNEEGQELLMSMNEILDDVENNHGKWLPYVRFVGTNNEGLWISLVQREQDLGTTWGAAVEYADNYEYN